MQIKKTKSMINLPIFITLCLCCLSGWMVVSYQGVAEKKGWPVGEFFSLEKGGFIGILGLVAQWGSVLISFFVNPWWTAPLVFAFGFLINMVATTVLKEYTQILSVILLIISYTLVWIYII